MELFSPVQISITFPLCQGGVGSQGLNVRNKKDRVWAGDVQSIQLDPFLPVLNWFGFRDDFVVGFQAFTPPVIAHEVHGA